MGLTQNLDEYGYQDASDLIARKKCGEQTVLDTAAAGFWRDRVQRVFTLLDEAHEKSQLQDEAGNEAELDAWLVDVRMRGV